MKDAVKIKIKFTDEHVIASTENGYSGTGRSAPEAVGNLVMSIPESFNIDSILATSQVDYLVLRQKGNL